MALNKLVTLFKGYATLGKSLTFLSLSLLFYKMKIRTYFI